MRLVDWWNLASLPFSVLRSSKEVNRNHGPISHSQFSADSFNNSVLHPTCLLLWTVWACSYFMLFLAQCWVCRPGMFGAPWQKCKGSMPASLLTQCPKRHITLFSVLLRVFVCVCVCKLTSTLSFYFSYLIHACESKIVHPQPVLSCQIL